VTDPAQIDTQGRLVLTVYLAAEELGLSPVTIRRAWREGRLKGSKGPGRTHPILITRQSVEDYRRLHLGKPGGVPKDDPRRSLA
jgi:hypothetical protein